MTKNDWKARLKGLEPCPDAYEWACQFKTFRQAWRMCERGDWMLWLIDEIDREAADEMETILIEIAFWSDNEDGFREGLLREAYIILDFMPDPPELPEVAQ